MDSDKTLNCRLKDPSALTVYNSLSHYCQSAELLSTFKCTLEPRAVWHCLQWTWTLCPVSASSSPATHGTIKICFWFIDWLTDWKLRIKQSNRIYVLQANHRCKLKLIDWIGFSVPTNTLQVISGTIWQVRWPNQQCQSTEGQTIVGQSTR